MRPYSWPFAGDREIQVNDSPAIELKFFIDSSQQVATVSITPLIVTGRKMPADITHCNCAQQSVTQCVQRDIAIRMRRQAPGVRYPHTAEHHVITLGKRVYIQSLSYSKIQGFIPSRTAAAR